VQGYGGGDWEWAPQAPGGWSGRPLTRARVCGGDFWWGWGGQAQRPHHCCEVRLGDRVERTCDCQGSRSGAVSAPRARSARARARHVQQRTHAPITHYPIVICPTAPARIGSRAVYGPACRQLQQWLNSACCLLARPAKANPRSRPIRAGDKSLGPGTQKFLNPRTGRAPTRTPTQSAGSQRRNETLIPEPGALHFREF
jgi:hypothetical protein